ncbi:MAG: ABC transporter permease [Actinobacteria bacterium]|nr:ABC transporter permease [Actinomycetota bacterium]
MELALLLRSGESLLVTLGIPLGLLVFFSRVDVLPTGDLEPVDFLVPGVLAISVMSTGLVALAIQTAFERKYLVLKRLGGTPLPRWGLVAGKALSALAVLAVQTLLIVAIAVAGLGWSASVGAVAWITLALVVGTFTFSAIGLLIAGTLRAEATLAVANTLYLALLLVSGLAFESETLPRPLEVVGLALPSGALGIALRDAVDGVLAVTPLLTVVAWGVAAALAAGRWFRWEP